MADEEEDEDGGDKSGRLLYGWWEYGIKGYEEFQDFGISGKKKIERDGEGGTTMMRSRLGIDLRSDTKLMQMDGTAVWYGVCTSMMLGLRF